MNQQKYFWQHYGEQKLLSLSFRELKLSLEAAPFRPWIDHYESELDSFGIRFRPHLWISEEWFSPDDVPGIAIPFYLCHTRLRALQRKYLFQVEGGSREEFLCIVRHEAGHAFETAFELSKEAQWRKIFGNPEKPYPARSYAPNPFSDHYVQNIKFWYAQSHPHEDFAETFAVCLRRGFNWRRRYRNAPIALRKLEYVESLLKELPRRKAKNVSRRKIDPSSRSALTLRAYYDREREQYALDEGSSMDGTLLRLFHREKERESVRASAFLR
ncbi:MAG: putative zinc-binding metallopeptidase, partial [Bdellovibrionales bacterium]|nr:putative zinc-binding metallopeptidase [Bdellovibrionales bacterium]